MIKKEFKEKALIGFSAVTIALIFMLSAPCGITAYASEGVIESEEESEDYSVMPFSDIIEYRYKVIGADVYRRLYNYTEQCWIGEWELCAEGYIKPGM